MFFLFRPERLIVQRTVDGVSYLVALEKGNEGSAGPHNGKRARVEFRPSSLGLREHKKVGHIMHHDARTNVNLSNCNPSTQLFAQNCLMFVCGLPAALVVSCMENDFIRSPAGVNAVFSVDGVWSLEDGDYARHETAVVVNEEYTTEGAFVEAAFYGEFSQGAAVSGSPITAVEFGVKVYDPAGNSEFCSFLLAIIPEEEEEGKPYRIVGVSWC